MAKHIYTLETKFYVTYLYRKSPSSQENGDRILILIKELQTICDLTNSDLAFTQGQLAIWIEAYLQKLTGYNITLINFWEV